MGYTAKFEMTYHVDEPDEQSALSTAKALFAIDAQEGSIEPELTED